MKKLKVYYAHPMVFYGSQIEYDDIKTLEMMGFEVLNPNHPNNEEAYHKRNKDFNLFLELVNSCDILAFRSIINKITIGVAKEIRFAETLGMPVIELPTITEDRILSKEETIKYFRPLNIVD